MGGVWLTPAEVAERLQVSVKTLERWRSGGRGPRFGRRGAVIRYRVVDVDEWMAGDDDAQG
jgi:excisionase family DNA binding protein